MRCLVVEDEFTSRRILQRLLSEYGECDVAISGDEAILAFGEALKSGQPYHLVCLDIMLPGMHGHEVLTALRGAENDHGVELGQGAKIMMTTSLSDAKSVMNAFRGGCEAYVVKPVTRDKVVSELVKLGFQIAA